MTWLLANTAVAALLGLVALGVGRWLKPAPAVMHGLWLVVLLKLVTPPLFEVPVDLAWWSASAGPVEPVIVPVELTEIGPVTLPPERAPLPAATVSGASTTSFVLWGWATGSALLLLFVALGAFRARRSHRVLGPVAPVLRSEVEDLARRLGVAVPELCDDPAAPAPYVWSLGRTRLMLPAATLLRCSPKGRAAVLAHELAHLMRRDHWVARAELVLAALLWWHPLFWFARRRMRLWAELACDAIAVANVPDANLDYATVLVDAAARPDSAVPGLAVLASRPAARAAFERRLTMILTQKLPRRVSPIWCVPFVALAFGLFTVPVAAQAEREEPIRIEIRINGERVTDLSNAERKALLKLLTRERGAEREAEKAEEPRQRVERRVERRTERAEPRRRRDREVELPPEVAELRGLLDGGLAEARREIARDEDLRELGITDEVLGLLDDIADGRGIESGLDDVIKAAMKGAGKMVIKEIEGDSDLKKLGIADGIGELVTGFLDNERNQEMIGELANKALHNAVKEAKREIRADDDLRELGIAGDVESLIDTVIGGGDLERDLERIIEKAMKGAMREIEREMGGGESHEEPEEPRRERRTRRSRRVIR